MSSLQPCTAQPYGERDAAPDATQELLDAVRVLAAVTRELAERVELLETRQAISDAVKA